MRTKQIISHLSLIRSLSFLCLFACFSQQSIAATDATGAVGSSQYESATAKQTIKQKKPPVSFQQVETFPALLQSEKLKMSDITSPHWNKNGCIACHKSTQSAATRDNLRYDSIEKTCYNCHSPAFDHSYIHPVDVRPDKKMLDGMDKTMRTVLAKSNNTVTCTTCHDMTLQCKSDADKQRLTNPKFFRNGPYQSRSQSCYLCHDKNQFRRLDPHDQIDPQGNIRPEKCRVCHADPIERLNQIENIDQLQFNARDSLSTMCWGCHPWTPHPGGQFTFFKKSSGPDHLIKPPDNIKKRLDEMTTKNEVVFPLEPGTGKVFCGTCHNAHERGVIKDPEDAKGADSKKRLREPEICKYCHLK